MKVLDIGQWGRNERFGEASRGPKSCPAFMVMQKTKFRVIKSREVLDWREGSVVKITSCSLGRPMFW